MAIGRHLRPSNKKELLRRFFIFTPLGSKNSLEICAMAGGKRARFGLTVPDYVLVLVNTRAKDLSWLRFRVKVLNVCLGRSGFMAQA